MKYLSIDIETTGLDAKNNDTIEVGAILEDTQNPLPREKCPTFHVYIDKPIYRGDPFALAMNHKIFQRICDIREANKKNEPTPYKLITPEDFTYFFKLFLKENGYSPKDKVLAGGKNFIAFDKVFLNEFPGFESIKFHHRVIDPAALYTDFKNDDAPADLKTCKIRAGFTNTEVTHTALDDAWDVIELIRAKS